jgi:phosphoribosyl 1,2-cyclic phosphate phosphodiesterase
MDPWIRLPRTKGSPVRIQAIPVPHGSQETLAFRFGNLALVTDCHTLPEAAMSALLGLETLVLDCVRLEPHPTHLHLEAALEIVKRLKPRRCYLTHLGHEFDERVWRKSLPKGVNLAYDGLRISFESFR